MSISIVGHKIFISSSIYGRQHELLLLEPELR